MTWDPLGLETLGENWVAAPEVVVSEEIIEETIFTASFEYPVHRESFMKFTCDIC